MIVRLSLLQLSNTAHLICAVCNVQCTVRQVYKNIILYFGCVANILNYVMLKILYA